MEQQIIFVYNSFSGCFFRISRVFFCEWVRGIWIRREEQRLRLEVMGWLWSPSLTHLLILFLLMVNWLKFTSFYFLNWDFGSLAIVSDFIHFGLVWVQATDSMILCVFGWFSPFGNWNSCLNWLFIVGCWGICLGFGNWKSVGDIVKCFWYMLSCVYDFLFFLLLILVLNF